MKAFNHYSDRLLLEGELVPAHQTCFEMNSNHSRRVIDLQEHWWMSYLITTCWTTVTWWVLEAEQLPVQYRKILDANISFQRRKCSLEERVAFPGPETCNPHRTAMKKGLAYYINFPSNTQSSGISNFNVFELHFALRVSVLSVNSAGRQV